MSESLFPVAQFQTMRTPFYYYDTVLPVSYTHLTLPTKA